jgi:uncharacterized protein YhaN
MRIEKLEIRGFGRFLNETFTPGGGMNVIYGFNEAGKTTLQSFIRGMLFGLKGGRRGREGSHPQTRLYRPWNGKSFGGILEYTLDDGRRFTVGRNFDKNTVYIQDEFSNNITAEFPADREQGAGFAEQHLGLSESSFERTSFIGQLQTPVDAEGRKILAERLLNLRESADEGISLRKAMKVLRDAQLSQVGSDRTTTRPLNVIEARLADAVNREKELIRLHESRMDIYLELDRLKKENSHLNFRLKEELASKENLLVYMKAAQQRELHNKLERYRSELAEVNLERQKHEAAIADLQSELDGLDGYKVYTQQDVNDLSVDCTRLELLEKELEEVRLKKAENEEKLAETQAILHQYALFDREKDAIEKDLQELLHEKTPEDGFAGTKQVSDRYGWSLPAALFAVAIIVSGSFLFRTSLPHLVNIAVISLGIALLAAALFFFAKGKKQSNEEGFSRKNTSALRERLLRWMQAVEAADLKEFTRVKALYENSLLLAGELEEEHALLEDRETRAKTRLEELRLKIRSLLERAGFQDGSGILTQDRIDSWKENFEAYYTLLPALKDARGAAEVCTFRKEAILREASLLYGETVATAEELENCLRKVKLGFEKLPVTTISQNASTEQFERTLESIREALRQNQLEMNTLTTRLENDPDSEELQQAHERVESLKSEKERMIILGKALDMAALTLAEAGLAIQRDYVPALNREMSDILHAITGGKYSHLKADDSLSLKLQPGESMEEVLPDQLSSGTIDQIYFALRLAAVRIVEKRGETLPLFLDEPFAQYDETRTKEALALLARESKTRQILLFTCKKREVELVTELFKNEPLCIINLNDTGTL